MYAKFLSATCYVNSEKLRQFNRRQCFSPRTLRNKPPDWLKWAKQETVEWIALRNSFDIARYSYEKGCRKVIGTGLLAHRIIIRLKEGALPTVQEVSRSIHYDVRYWGLLAEKVPKHLYGPFYLFEFVTSAYDDRPLPDTLVPSWHGAFLRKISSGENAYCSPCFCYFP